MAEAKQDSSPPTYNVGKPTNSFVQPLLNDLYQLTMTYAYWKTGRAEDVAVFDLFFRKNPFKGEYTIFAGLTEVLRFVESFSITEEDVTYLRTVMPHCEDEFFEFLKTLDCSQLKIYAQPEGSVVFPRVPLLRMEGPLPICQLMETVCLNLTNYASLMATNAARFRRAAGPDKLLLEFGLRRAQGPDGALSASRYSYLGGFDGSSNVLSGKLFGIPIKGTHAHSFVCSYTSLDDLRSRQLDGVDLVERVIAIRKAEGWARSNDGELAAFIAYAQAFPDGFLALVDTYDTLTSGVPNFLCVALALHQLGHRPIGIRLDSGDLAWLSKCTRDMFNAFSERHGVPFQGCSIVASNDINEPILHSLNDQGHEINAFGIGTHLVTCQAQPALGMVYKLVEVNGEPRIKLSNEITKVTIPGKKVGFRLFGGEGHPLCDLMIREGELEPAAGRRILCRHPFDEKKRVYVCPSSVLPLHSLVWDGAQGVQQEMPPLETIRSFCKQQLSNMREDHLRALNPTPYKVSVSSELFSFTHELWMREVPIPELS